MTLAEYCASTGEKLDALARRMGLKRGHLNKIAKGDRDPSMDLARRISEATDGKVTPTDLAFAKKLDEDEAEPEHCAS